MHACDTLQYLFFMCSVINTYHKNYLHFFLFTLYDKSWMYYSLWVFSVHKQNTVNEEERGRSWMKQYWSAESWALVIDWLAVAFRPAFRPVPENVDLHVCPRSLSSEGCLACHTYSDTGHPFIMVISEVPWHSHLLPGVSNGAVTTFFTT